MAPITVDNSPAVRAGLPLDIVSWIALAAASGVLGNLTYDAVRRVVHTYLRRRTSPSPKAAIHPGPQIDLFPSDHATVADLVLHSSDCEEQELVVVVAFTTAEIERYVLHACRFARRRLSVVRKTMALSSMSKLGTPAKEPLNSYAVGRRKGHPRKTKVMQIVGSPAELSAQGVVEVVVPDLDLALSFYRRLGFTVERETSMFVTLRWDSLFLSLAQNADATTAPRWANVRIIVTDVDTVWNRVNQLKIPVGSSIADRPYGLRDFTVRDPAGFEIRFAQVL